MPWASDTSVASYDTFDLRGNLLDAVYLFDGKWNTYQGSSVMCAVGRHGVETILGFDKQDLAALDAFDFILSLLTVLEVDAGQALELVLGGHAA
jgi:hypothetical protein